MVHFVKTGSHDSNKLTWNFFSVCCAGSRVPIIGARSLQHTLWNMHLSSPTEQNDQQSWLLMRSWRRIQTANLHIGYSLTLVTLRGLSQTRTEQIAVQIETPSQVANTMRILLWKKATHILDHPLTLQIKLQGSKWHYSLAVKISRLP